MRDREAHRERAVGRVAAVRLARREHERGTQALPPAEQRVPERLDEPGRAAPGARVGERLEARARRGRRPLAR